MIGSSSRSGDGPRRRFRMRSGATSVWSVCAHVTVAVGLVCAVARWGWVGPISAALLLAIMVASAAAAMLATDTRELPRMMLIGLVAGVGLTAMGGLVAVFEVTGLCVVLLVVATCPAVHARVRRVWRSLTATSDAAAEAAPGGRGALDPRGRPAAPAHTACSRGPRVPGRRRAVPGVAAKLPPAPGGAVGGGPHGRRRAASTVPRASWSGGVPAASRPGSRSGARASGNPLPFLGDRPDP